MDTPFVDTPFGPFRCKILHHTLESLCIKFLVLSPRQLHGSLRGVVATQLAGVVTGPLWRQDRKILSKTVLGPASAWNRFRRDFLEVLGASEANFLEVCFGRIPHGNSRTKATSKKSVPPSGNFRPNPPELPRSPSRHFSSHEAGWKTL